MRMSPVSAALEHSVLASRLNSCARKSSRRPDRFARLEQQARRLDMRLEPVDLLLNVGPACQDRHLLMQPVGIKVGTRFEETSDELHKPRPDRRHRARRTVARRHHQAVDLIKLVCQHLGQPCAFADLHLPQRSKELVGALQQHGVAGLRLGFLAFRLTELDHARQREQAFDRRRRCTSGAATRGRSPRAPSAPPG